jgi:hypothetical protein
MAFVAIKKCSPGFNVKLKIQNRTLTKTVQNQQAIIFRSNNKQLVFVERISVVVTLYP